MSLTVYLASFLAAWLVTVVILGQALRRSLATRSPGGRRARGW